MKILLAYRNTASKKAIVSLKPKTTINYSIVVIPIPSGIRVESEPIPGCNRWVLNFNGLTNK